MRMSGLCKVEMSAFMGGWGPMETERIASSQRGRDRLKVLHEVKQKHLTQVEAGKRLKLSDRHVRRLLLAIRERGDRVWFTGCAAVRQRACFLPRRLRTTSVANPIAMRLPEKGSGVGAGVAAATMISPVPSTIFWLHHFVQCRSR